MDFKLEVVPVPVADVDRAKQFYAEQMGFAVDHDTAIGHIRIVQLTPPGSGCSIVLGAGTESTPGSLQGIQLVVDDIAAARQLIRDRGVEAGPVQHFEEGAWVDGPGGDWNNFVFLKDPDGNGLVLQERPRRK